MFHAGRERSMLRVVGQKKNHHSVSEIDFSQKVKPKKFTVCKIFLLKYLWFKVQMPKNKASFQQKHAKLRNKMYFLWYHWSKKLQ